jgi:hypothetical protein
MLGNSKALQKPTGENEHRMVRSRQRENRSPESPGSASAASAPRPASGAACPPRRRWQVSAVLGAQEERRPGPQDAQRRSNACGSVKCVISTVTAQLRRNCRQETAGYDGGGGGGGGGGGVDRGRGLPEDEGEHISHRLQRTLTVPVSPPGAAAGASLRKAGPWPGEGRCGSGESSGGVESVRVTRNARRRS